jgi:tetratricopeptide (TPR) repeat protein
LTDVFVLQDEITATITARLGSSIERAELDASRRKPPSNLGAYDYYLRARALRLNTSGSEAGLRLRVFCEKAIELDPQFSPPYAELAHNYLREVAERWDISKRKEAIAKGLAAATHAIVLDPSNSVAHMAMGMLLFRSGDYEGGETSGLKAIELNPNDPESYTAQANLLYYTNRSREALALFQKARLLNPFYPPIYDYFLGRCYLAHGDLDRAIAYSHAAIRRLPNFWPPTRSSLRRMPTAAVWRKRKQLLPRCCGFTLSERSRVTNRRETISPDQRQTICMKASILPGCPNDPHAPPRRHHGR